MGVAAWGVSLHRRRTTGNITLLRQDEKKGENNLGYDRPVRLRGREGGGRPAV